jgi:hydrogenase maturation protease
MPKGISSIGECAIKTLVIGYGNPGRLDDGLGPAFAERIKSLDLPGVTVESNYQLNIEDAELISSYDVVVFADASLNCTAPYDFQSLEQKAPMIGFSSHSISASSLLGLANELFGASPRAWSMAIRGYDFNEFGEYLSPRAQDNLESAVRFFTVSCAAASLDAGVFRS